jgi:S-adenosylmethionine/arginine decarboxylase-like enzyme
MWGYEYIADCGNCDYDKICSLENIQSFVDELCDKTQMKKMGALHSHYLENNANNKKRDITGYSVCQFIQTSSIVLHLCEESRSVYINFFSCKKFSTKVVASVIRKYFAPVSIRDYYLTRDAQK